MRVPAKDLTRLIREIAQDEIKKQLPGMIREFLTENYLRRIMSEQASRRPVRETFMDEVDHEEEEEIPEPEAPYGEHDGVYHHANPKLQGNNEVLSRLMAPDNPLAFIYEGVKPIDRVENEEARPDEVPVDRMANVGFDFKKMRELSRAMERKATESAPMQTPQMKLRELEERRRALEVPAK